MKRNLIILFIIALSSLVFALEAGEKELTVKCVVSGEEVDKDEYTKYKDGKVYFCCAGCKSDFEEDASKFTTAANYQLVATGQYVQESCPLTARNNKADKQVDVDGLAVTFCCNNCLKKAKKSTDKLSMLFSDATFDKSFGHPKPDVKKTDVKKEKSKKK